MTDSYNTLILIMGKCFITMFLIVVFFFYREYETCDASVIIMGHTDAAITVEIITVVFSDCTARVEVLYIGCSHCLSTAGSKHFNE